MKIFTICLFSRLDWQYINLKVIADNEEHLIELLEKTQYKKECRIAINSITKDNPEGKDTLEILDDNDIKYGIIKE